MISGLPMVMARKLLRSALSRQGSPPAAPMTLFSATATTMATRTAPVRASAAVILRYRSEDQDREILVGSKSVFVISNVVGPVFFTSSPQKLTRFSGAPLSIDEVEVLDRAGPVARGLQDVVDAVLEIGVAALAGLVLR